MPRLGSNLSVEEMGLRGPVQRGSDTHERREAWGHGLLSLPRLEVPAVLQTYFSAEP